MAPLIHRTKTTHCYSATEEHFQDFFATLTHMYEEQAHTDVHLVAKDGTLFGVHRMVLGGPSAFIRSMFPAEEPCECNTLTVIMPDFDAATIKNLLGLLYTGTSSGDCHEDDLRDILDTLKMDLVNLDGSSAAAQSSMFKISHVASITNKRRSVSNAHLGLSSNGLHDNDDQDEMIEVVPEIYMGMGNHFLSDMNGGGGDHSDEDSNHQPQIRLKKTSNLLAASAANDQSDLSDSNLNGTNDELALAGTSSGSDKQFLCRLCGRSAPSGAALFAHLLYPHYAHLWRTEIPHRANQYLCKQCPYSTTKRQHFVQHVAKVHEDLKKKLIALGENLEVLDNLNPKNTNGSTERILSKVAKFKSSDDLSYEDNLAMSASEYSNVNSPMPSAANESSIDSPSLLASLKEAANVNMASTLLGSNSKAAKLELNSFGLIPGRFPRGYKPFVKCRLCGKGWKGKDNFFTHLVSTHFKHMWSNEVPKHADMFKCHVGTCQYQSKYRYNFLFHLAGKHKQLKEKLAKDGISLDVLVPIEVDEVDDEMLAGGSPTLLKNQSLAMQSHFMNNEVTMQKFLAATAPPPNSGGGGRTPSHGKYSAANSTVRLICRVCKKISFNHTCHRQHVVSKHFQDFWAEKTPDRAGLFNCHHCDYQTPNRSVFVIHLAYTHSELKTKLKDSGNNPDLADPDVYGKRKYRRSNFDNSTHLVHQSGGGSGSNSSRNAKRRQSAASEDAGASAEQELLMPPPASTTTVVPGGGAPEKHKYVCRLCKTEFGRQKAIVEHLALAHFYQVWEDDRPENGSFYVAPEGPFVCQHCPFTSSARAAFIAHFVNQHEALKSVMSLQYGDKTIEDLYTVTNGGFNNEDETYDEGDEDEDDIDDDEENAPDDEEMEEMDEEMDGQMSDMEFNSDNKMSESGLHAAETASSGW